ncbi:MAG: HepT-like ribonuclease domain-containing protein [Candidatus Micrarchaeaceae archaeon]
MTFCTESVVKLSWKAIIESYTKGITSDKFDESQELQDAVLRRLEIIGEATKNIPQDIKDRNKNVPWTFMAGMRDVIIHEYFGVRMDTIWKTITDDLPKVKKNVAKLLKDL